MFKAKLEALRATIERETLARLQRQYGTGKDWRYADSAKRARARIVPGRIYTKVDVGESGKYMVVNETGEIFGIKAYGVIHRGHRYGTLDTIGDYDWGGYTAIPKGEADGS